jgi:hypothetical protein
MAVEFPTIGEAPQNGKFYTLASRSNPSNFMTRTSWDGAFYLMPYNADDIQKAVFKAIDNQNGTWSFTIEKTETDDEGIENVNTYYVGIPFGYDNLNANISWQVAWTVEEGEYPGFYKIKAGEGQGNTMTIGGYLHLNAGNQYAVINESTNSWFPDYYGGVQMDEYDYPVTDETGLFPIPLNTISQNWAFIDASLDLASYNIKVQLYQLLQDIEDNNLADETYKAGFQNAIDAALPYYQKDEVTNDDLDAAKAIIDAYNSLYKEILAAKELLGENSDATFEQAISSATTSFNTKGVNLIMALESLKAAEEEYAKGSGDLTILGQNMSFEDLSSQGGNQSSSVAGAPTGWNVYVNGQQVQTADEVRAAGISAWHGINNDAEGETKDGDMAFGLWNSGVPKYELSQTISGLEDGSYIVKAALMVGANGNGSRRTTQRIFGNLNSTYFANDYDYDENRLDKNEVYGFAGLEEPVTDRLMQEISVQAFVYDGTLTFGIRTNGDYAAAKRENSNGAGGDGWFKVDNFRIEKVGFVKDDAILIYLHFANSLDQLSGQKMEESIANEAENTLKQYKVDDSSSKEQIIAAFNAIREMYAKAKHSAELYEQLAAAMEKALANLMLYENSASAGDFGDLYMEIEDAYNGGTANEEDIMSYIQKIEEGIEELKATAVSLGDVTFTLKNPSFEDLSNQGNTPSDGAVNAPKGWTLFVNGEVAETVSSGWCAINKGDAISAMLDDGTEVYQQPTEGDHLWGIWNSNMPEVELSQTLKGMPAGTYTVKADVMVQYNWAGDNTTTQRIFGNNCVQMWGTEEAYSELNMPADALNAADLTYAGHICAPDLYGSANSDLLHPMQVTFGVAENGILKIGFRTNGININGLSYGNGGLNGQGWFKVDNFRLTYDSEEIPSGINAISETAKGMSEIYNINGIRMNTLRHGLNIVRMTQADGTTKAKIVIVK